MTKQTNGWQESGFRWRRWRVTSWWVISTNLNGLFVFAHWKWMQTMSQTPESRNCQEYPRTSSRTKGVVDKGEAVIEEVTQEIERKQGRVRDSENGSKGEPTTMTKKSLQRETRTRQQSLVTYDNPENDSAYHGLSRSGCTAVFCDNIVQMCLVLSLTLNSLRRNTIHHLK